MISKFVDYLGDIRKSCNYIEMPFSALKCDICDKFDGVGDMIFTWGGIYEKAGKKNNEEHGAFIVKY